MLGTRGYPLSVRNISVSQAPASVPDGHAVDDAQGRRILVDADLDAAVLKAILS